MSPARAVYTAVVWLAMPLAALYLLWRSRRQPDYRAHWGERFGWARFERRSHEYPLIWVHAVSVGETRAAAPLIAALAERYPRHRFLLTHMTPTGRASGRELAARWPGRIEQLYLPYDLPFAVRRFLAAFAPVVGLGMETETWPNLLAAAKAARVPMVLVNARLSERSLAKARWAPSLIRETAGCFSQVLAQSQADAARLREVGAGSVTVVGNLKFDYTPDPQLVQRGAAFKQSAAQRSVLLFASTREGEEELLLTALERARGFADAAPIVLFVPRHPQRFDEVARAIEARGRPVVRRSETTAWSVVNAAVDAVWLGDSMGEMAMYYASADVAYIGGSLLPLGGQNLIEACAVGLPVVVGPHTFNFAQATDDAVAAGAAERCADADGVLRAMLTIVSDGERRSRMSQAATRFAHQHRGATARSIAVIAPLIDGRDGSSRR
jgi:3-deoxy-D-manno-octulosonic-acid transferase